MEYSKILKRAWQITWRHKVLWLFGLLIAFFGGAAAWRPSRGLSYGIDASDLQNWSQRWPGLFGQRWGWRTMPLLRGLATGQYTGAIVALLALLGFLGLIWAIASVIVRYTSTGALIGAVDDIEQGHAPRFRSSWRRGWPRFLRLFAIDLLIGLAAVVATLAIVLVSVVAALIVAGPLLITGGDPGLATTLGAIWAVLAGLVWVVLFVAVLVAFGGLVGVVREYAFRACVLHLKGVAEAVRAGLALTKSRFRETLSVWLILMGIGLVLGLLSVPAAAIGAGTVLVPAFAARDVIANRPAMLLLAAPLALAAMAVVLLLTAIYQVFVSSLWTLTYRELVPAAEERLPAL
ncbi:MAG: hypothetical protein GX557_06855 [Chloroflexi bacterium]|nr:hypothetical protein [Chloroflexota bacterium]